MEVDSLSEGDVVVYETWYGYTTTGKIVDLPPWSVEVGGKEIVQRDKANIQTFPDIPTTKSVPVDAIIGLREDVDPDEEVHTWEEVTN